MAWSITRASPEPSASNGGSSDDETNYPRSRPKTTQPQHRFPRSQIEGVYFAVPRKRCPFLHREFGARAIHHAREGERDDPSRGAGGGASQALATQPSPA